MNIVIIIWFTFLLIAMFADNYAHIKEQNEEIEKIQCCLSSLEDDSQCLQKQLEKLHKDIEKLQNDIASMEKRNEN